LLSSTGENVKELSPKISVILTEDLSASSVLFSISFLLERTL